MTSSATNISLDKDTITSFLKQVNLCKQELPKNNHDADRFGCELDSILSILQASVTNCNQIERTIEEEESSIYFIREQASVAKDNLLESHALQKKIQNEIRKHKEDIENFKKMEITKKDQIDRKIQENEKVTTLMKFGSGWTPEQSVEREKIVKSIENEKSVLNEFKLSLESKRRDSWNRDIVVRSEQEKQEEVMSQVQEIELKLLDANKEFRTKEMIKATKGDEMEKVKKEIFVKKENYEELEKLLALEDTELKSEEGETKEAYASLDQCTKEYEQLYRDGQNSTSELEKIISINKQMTQDNQKAKETLSKKKTEAKSDRKTLAKLKKMHNIMMKKLNQIEKQRLDVEKRRDQLKLKTKTIEGIEMRQARKKLESNKRQIDDLKREMEVLSRKINLSQNATSKVEEITILKKNKLENLENELVGLDKAVKSHEVTIQSFDEDDKKLEKNLANARRVQSKLIGEINGNGQKIGEFEEELFKTESKLREQQNLFETAQNEKNSHSKMLKTIHVEIDEAKKSSNIIKKQIHQLKQDIAKIEYSLVKEHFHHHNVEKENKYFQKEIERMKKIIADNSTHSVRKEKEIRELLKVIEKVDVECQNNKKNKNIMLSERDAFGNQLVSKNALIEKLNQQIKLQLSTLHKESLYYQSRITEIDSLRNKCRKIILERNEVAEKVEGIESLERKYVALDSDLLKERTRNKVLLEELGRPINVHRLRHLEHIDPTKFGKVRKIQNLQKRIISTSDDLTEKDRQIRKLELVYTELKVTLGRVAPFEGMEEKVEEYEINLDEQKKQMTALNTELGLYKLKVEKLKEKLRSIEKCDEDLKSAWMRKKSEELQNKEEEKE